MSARVPVLYAYFKVQNNLAAVDGAVIIELI